MQKLRALCVEDFDIVFEYFGYYALMFASNLINLGGQRIWFCFICFFLEQNSLFYQTPQGKQTVFFPAHTHTHTQSFRQNDAIYKYMYPVLSSYKLNHVQKPFLVATNFTVTQWYLHIIQILKIRFQNSMRHKTQYESNTVTALNLFVDAVCACVFRVYAIIVFCLTAYNLMLSVRTTT